MDYKKEIIEMIEKMHNITFIAMIHAFAHTLFEKEKLKKMLIIRTTCLKLIYKGKAVK